jgi:hypothetical protein
VIPARATSIIPVSSCSSACNITSTKYFVAHQDYLQVYPGDPINVLGTVRVRLRKIC